MLWATGTENSGISVFIQDDKLVVDYNVFDDHTVVESTSPCRRASPRSPPGSAAATAGGTARAGRQRRRRPAAATLALFMRMISSVGSSIGPITARPFRPATTRRFRSPASARPGHPARLTARPGHSGGRGPRRDDPPMTLTVTLLGTGSPLPEPRPRRPRHADIGGTAVPMPSTISSTPGVAC